MNYRNYERSDLIDLVRSLNRQVSALEKERSGVDIKEVCRKQSIELQSLRVRNAILEREFERIARDYDDILINSALFRDGKRKF